MRVVSTLTLALFVAFASSAQTAEPSMQQELMDMLSKNKNSNTLGSALAVGALLGCTVKAAGREATQAFYTHAMGVGRSIDGLCKKGDKATANAAFLSALDADQSHPVLKTILGCYDKQSPGMAGMVGEKAASRAAFFARWLRSPATAHEEIKTTDICKL